MLEKLEEQVLTSEHDNIPTIEKIQDAVEIELMDMKLYDVAKHFILYRDERRKKREKRKEKLEKKIESNSLNIIKQNGKKEAFDIYKVKETYKRVNYGLSRVCHFEELSESLKKYIVEDMKTEDILKMMIKSSVDLISIENTSWQFIAGRLALIDLYKKSSNNRGMNIKNIYSPKSYKKLFDEYIEAGLYYKKFYDYYSPEDILEAGKHLNKETDLSYNYTTMMMYNKRYLLNPNKIVKELPQEMYMSIALFLAIPEPKEKRLETALKIYEYCATGKISLPTPTLLNARTNYHQLSSCFKLNVDDDLRGIYHNVENMAQISKFGGGIGVYLGNIRSRGGTIRGVKGVSG